MCDADLAMRCSAHAPVSEHGRFAAGTVFGDWRTTAFIGRGGNGEVYCAEHVALGTPAAVKVLTREEERAKERFAREAQSTVLELDIRAYRYQLCFPDSIPQRLEVCRRLAEEYGAHARYSEIVELLLSEAETDSAAYYLERLQPQDSAYAYWFEQSYTYLQSKILQQEGKSGEAYSLLLDLYDLAAD